MSELKTHKTLSRILLLGAGASIPADIPSIDKMTLEFLAKPLGDKPRDNSKDLLDNESSYKRKFLNLSNIASIQSGKSDLETIMSVIINLLNKETRSLFSSKYWDETGKLFKKINNGHLERYSTYDETILLRDLKDKLENYIRNKCESINSIEYLWPLKGIAQNGKLDIFTLNYDATIEMFCEKNVIDFTDGFTPYWTPEKFAENSGINIYKLHGSLYWLRTESGKAIKVPIKGLRVSDVKYLTDESVSEMMIYPTLQKNKQPIVYSWLSQKFKETLNHIDICVIIGYSFRDEDIRETLIESMLANKRLWVILVNPDAPKHKTEFFSNNEIQSKVVVMKMGTEEALRDRKLHSYLQTLESARTAEDEATEFQQSSQIRLDVYNWNFVLKNYLSIEHHDRIRWLVEKLEQEKFIAIQGKFPDTIEGIVCPWAFSYAYEYYQKKNHLMLDLWIKVFLESCTALEYVFFDGGGDVLRSNNPIKDNEIPSSLSGNSGSNVYGIITEMKKELEKTHIYKDKKLKTLISNLIETLSILTFKKNIKRDSYTPITGSEIVDEYQKKNLGVRKWSIEISNYLKKTN